MREKNEVFKVNKYEQRKLQKVRVSIINSLR
jgi:hypothetical protein